MDIEIAKCDKKLDLARLNLEKIKKMEAQADYEETVPANVRLFNEDKVRILGSLNPRVSVDSSAFSYSARHMKRRLQLWSYLKSCLRN